jgi:thiamine biosynthesis lipoprotein
MQLKFGAMGSRFHINVVGAQKAFLAELKAEVERLESLWSRFREDSEITLLNNSDGAPVYVSSETTLLVKKMLSAFELTGGAFNPGLLPNLLKVGYADSLGEAGSTQLKDSKVAGFSTSDVLIDGPFITLDPKATLDPGGIGKGLCADLLSEKIQQAGFDSYFVNAGGDLYGEGSSPDGDPWRISIEDPFDIENEICQVTFEKAGVATSSNLKRTFAGRSHLIDPQISTNDSDAIASVTVISGSAARSEVLAKACFFKPQSEAFEIIEKNNAAALIVTKNRQVSRSTEWNKFEC